MRFSHRPVVVAPHGMTLGGGCEVVMGGDAAVAGIETYIGLVEVGAGVIPAGGGCKEFVRRIDEAAPEHPETDLFPYVRTAFETIGMAKVATSGHEAIEMGLLRPTDHVTINHDGRTSGWWASPGCRPCGWASTTWSARAGSAPTTGSWATDWPGCWQAVT
jgi:enoyl-CoA hydratase/carnithine racemase